MQVILSPFANPRAFWGELFQADKLWFVLSIVLPCGLMSVLAGWRTCLAILPPLGVLLVWDHDPATCIAFQYTSVLLPILWLATLQGSRRLVGRLGQSGSALAALTTGGLLSLFVGGLPFSQSSITDVIFRTYGETALSERAPDGDLGRWLQKQTQALRQDGRAVLATGRIAAHLVGNRDVETVSQYLERRPQLAELPDRENQPLLAYTWILVDQAEQFQQSPEQIEKVLVEARAEGFEQAAQKGPLLLLRREP